MRTAWLGPGIPGKREADLPGRLIVLEGADCSGRSTQVRLLHDWLENQGYGVVVTSLCRSDLAEEGLHKAKRRNEVSRRTLLLFYAADLADRLERQILPALEGGFIVLSDRYVYTLLARYAARGLEPAWLRTVFGFALEPHLGLYLNVKLDRLAERALHADRMDFWECGMDLNLSPDYYESFLKYQRRMLREFNGIAREFGLERIPGNDDMNAVQLRLRARVGRFLARCGGGADGPRPAPAATPGGSEPAREATP